MDSVSMRGNISDEHLDPNFVEGRQVEGSESDSDNEIQNIAKGSSSISSTGSCRVPCLNRCGEVVESRRLECHIADDCPLTVTDCEFKHVGCDVRLPRRDMPVHLGQAVVLHLSKQAANNEERLKMLEVDNERLAAKCKRLEKEYEELRQRVGNMFIAFMNTKEIPKDPNQSSTVDHHENTNAAAEHKDNISYSYVFATKTEPTSLTPEPMKRGLSMPANLTMTNFEQHKKNNDHWVSEPFLTHTQGYKMCLRVTANGQGSGKDTHITVGIYLMKGEFDEQLGWPFRGDITIQLLNQQGSNEHYTRTVYRAKGDRDKTKTGEKFISAWGISQFKPHSELHPKYLKNDCLKFQIYTIIAKQSELSPQCQMTETEV